MYQEYFKLNSLPFENTCDPRFFFASEQHREALAAIEYSIRLRKGIVLVTGDVGSGKTTVGRVMCDNCGDRATIVHVISRRHNGEDLLKQILRCVNLPATDKDSYATMLERLRGYLTDQVVRQQPVVLFVDEAQNLHDDALEELRLLSNLDTPNQKLVQVVLVGQPELRQRIRQTAYDALRQRIAMAKQLHPFEHEETSDYIAHRLGIASIDPQDIRVHFSPGAIREIHRVTGGIARLINVVCDNCLLLGFVKETRQIDTAMVHQVIQDMVPRFDDTPHVNDRSTSTFSLAGNF